MHPEGGRLSLDKNKNRRLKTPSQVGALENFYIEHKYPSEWMKSQFAEEIGLSLKQVSGWFCHRRLKDKRLVNDEVCGNGNQTFSSSVMQDRSSGHRQESCSSNKHGDFRPSDLREAESKRSYKHNFLAELHASERLEQHLCKTFYDTVNDRSSGNSLASRERLLHDNVDPDNIEPLRYSILDENFKMNTKGIKIRGYLMESRNPYFWDEDENPVIFAVKRKLGRHYREDGPPLSVDFQPLPPGAFDSPSSDSLHETYYVDVGDRIHHSSRCMPRFKKGSKVFDRYSCEMLSQSTHLEKIDFKRTPKGYHQQDEFSCYPLTQKASFTNWCDITPGWTSVLEMGRGYVGENFYFKRDKHGKCSKYNAEWRSSANMDSNSPLHRSKPVKDKELPYLHSYNGTRAQIFQGGGNFGAIHSKSVIGHSICLDTENRLPHRRLLKEEKLCKERVMNDHSNPIQPKIPVNHGIKMGQRVRNGEFRQHGYVQAMPSPTDFPWKKSDNKDAGDYSTSFSEDESGGNSSSVD